MGKISFFVRGVGCAGIVGQAVLSVAGETGSGRALPASLGQVAAVAVRRTATAVGALTSPPDVPERALRPAGAVLGRGLLGAAV